MVHRVKNTHDNELNELSPQRRNVAHLNSFSLAVNSFLHPLVNSFISFNSLAVLETVSDENFSCWSSTEVRGAGAIVITASRTSGQRKKAKARNQSFVFCTATNDARGKHHE